MMNLINEKHKPIIANDSDLHDSLEKQYFWTYDFKEHDFFLKNFILWQSVKSDCYVFRIERGTIKIPFNYYIMIGDYDGGLDFITPEEITGRTFSAFTFSSDFSESSWELSEMTITGYEKNVNFVIPYIKKPFPVLISENRAIMVSGSDMYSKIKEIGLSDIL